MAMAFSARTGNRKGGGIAEDLSKSCNSSLHALDVDLHSVEGGGHRRLLFFVKGARLFEEVCLLRTTEKLSRMGVERTERVLSDEIPSGSYAS
jgi:hypothetical protein